MTRTLRILQSIHNATAPSLPETPSSESDYVVILAALLCALICVLGLIAVSRCAWLRRRSAPTASGNSPTDTLSNKGLKKKVLNSLPKFTISAAGDNNKNWIPTSECAICLSEFSAGDEVRVVPNCGHGFHVACIDKWFDSHSSCPSCRAVLPPARCQKCGQLPAVVGREIELKFVGSGGDDGATGNANCNSGFLP